MIVDTSALLALFNADEKAHDSVVAALDGTVEPLVVSPYVVAELAYLVATRFGVNAEFAVLRELAGGAWTLPPFPAEHLETAARVIERYSDQLIGVADASVVVLADLYGTRTVATLDRRHFGVVRPLRGGKFTIVP
ncbi:MAG: PIN domain-containing protein [Actinomycetes bacterium]